MTPMEVASWTILINHCARAIERLLIVGIAGMSVYFSYRLARQSANQITLRDAEGSLSADSNYKFKIGGLVAPAAVLPLVAVFAFIGLGLKPTVETTWPVVPVQAPPAPAASPGTAVEGTPSATAPANRSQPPSAGAHAATMSNEWGASTVTRTGGEMAALNEACDRLRKSVSAQSKATDVQTQFQANTQFAGDQEHALDLAERVYGKAVTDILRDNIRIGMAHGRDELSECRPHTSRQVCELLAEAAVNFRDTVPQ